MFKFIANDDSEKLDAALAKGGKVNEQNKKGETLVMACVESGALECLKLLLSRGADLELRDKNGDTAAIRAVKNGEVQALEALVSHRPRCALAADSSGWTALHWAVKLTEAATLELLLENHEAKELILKADKEGRLPVHVAVSSSCSEDVLNRLLQANKQQLELVEKKTGRTPLLVAIASGNVEAAALLIKLGASENALDNKSRNLLHCAIESGELPSGFDISRFLLSPDAEGNTPLHVAAKAGDQKMFAELKKLGADELKPNLDGKTALDLYKEAVQQDEQEMQKLVAEEARKQEEKAAAARAAEIAKQKTAERAFEAASQRTAEKYAERNAKRRARAAERAAEGLGEEEEEEEEVRAPDRKEDPTEPKIKSGKRQAEVLAPREPVVIGGTKSIIWMVVVVALFLGVFLLSKILSKTTKK